MKIYSLFFSCIILSFCTVIASEQSLLEQVRSMRAALVAKANSESGGPFHNDIVVLAAQGNYILRSSSPDSPDKQACQEYVAQAIQLLSLASAPLAQKAIISSKGSKHSC